MLNLIKQTVGCVAAIAVIPDAKRNNVLLSLAETLEQKTDEMLVENKKDLDAMDTHDPKYDRLKLTPERILNIANDIRKVALLPSPLGVVLEERDLVNGLHLQKMSVPLGVIGIIYEARPNVTFDAFALCFKSGNAVILKGGSDAQHSNIYALKIIQSVLKKHHIDEHCVGLLPADRTAVNVLLGAVGLVDIVIPRGSRGLIDYVRENAKVPVIETGAGVCHTYVDGVVDIEKAKHIICNAKTARPSVCNALDCLLLHENRLSDAAELCSLLAFNRVEIYADEASYCVLEGCYPNELLFKATEEDMGKEWLSLRMTIKTVSSLNEALQHIRQYSSKHSEAILSEDTANINQFLHEVDAGAVYSNASTYFTDGAQFGLGAEIGISTQKLHARGPMGLKELTTYKYVLRGEGQIRN